MKKIIRITTFLMVAAVTPMVKAQQPFQNANICPGSSIGITAINSLSLSNPSYSLNPGGIVSSNPVFTVTPSAPTTYTLYVTGTDPNSVMVTTNNTVSLSFLSGPVFSLPYPIPYSAVLGCGTKSIAAVDITNANTYPIPSGSMTFSFFAPGTPTVYPIAGVNSSTSCPVNTTGTWTVAVLDNNNMCASWGTFSVGQDISPPVAQINGAPAPGNCGGPIETLVNGSSNTSTLFQNPLGTSAILWEGPAPQAPASYTPVYLAYTSGIYTMTVRDQNNFCTSTKTVNVAIMPVAAFAHTITGGQVTFSNVSTNTNSITAFYWEFGDGTTSLLENPTHTYLSGGSHLVKFATTNPGISPVAFLCTDTIIQSVNVSGIPCLANSGFTLVPTNTPQVWDAIPDYPWNIAAASWDWGDGATSNTLYAGHQYASAGLYNICLSVTVSCAASSSTCLSYNVYRGAAQEYIVAVNVKAPALISGLASVNANQPMSWNLVPNPNAGEFSLNLDATSANLTHIVISDVTGRMVHEQTISAYASSVSVATNNLPSGMYFVTVSSGNLKTTKRMVINR